MVYTPPPAPTTQDEALELLHQGGPDYIRAAMLFLEGQTTNTPKQTFVLRLAHWLLERAGYLLQELYDKPEGYFGAGGGGGKPPW